MNLTDEQVTKLDEFMTHANEMIGVLLNQIKTGQVSGEIDKRRIHRFADAYQSFVDSVH